MTLERIRLIFRALLAVVFIGLSAMNAVLTIRFAFAGDPGPTVVSAALSMIFSAIAVRLMSAGSR